MLPVHQRLIHWLEERGELDRALEFLPERRRDREARAPTGSGLKSPGVLGARRLRQARAQGGPAASVAARRAVVRSDPGRLLPAAAARDVRRRSCRATRCAARSSPTRSSTRWSTAAASRSSSGPGRRPAPPRSRSRGRSSCAARCSGWPAYVARGRGARQRRADRGADELYLEFRRLLDRASAGCCSTGPTRSTSTPRSSGSRPGRRELRARVPELLQRRRARRGSSERTKELEKLGVPEDAGRAGGGPARRVLAARRRRDRRRARAAPPSDVAPCTTSLSERFGIDAMLTRVTELPRDDRWDALARGALRYDLYAVLEALTRSVLEASTATTPTARIEEWETANTRRAGAGQTALHGDPAARQRGTRGPVGGAADAALGDPVRHPRLTARSDVCAVVSRQSRGAVTVAT